MTKNIVFLSYSPGFHPHHTRQTQNEWVNTIAQSLAEEDLNNDNRTKKNEILIESAQILKGLKAISETLSNHTGNITRDQFMPFTYTITSHFRKMNN